MGINSSGVRQIAEAAGPGDKMRIAQPERGSEEPRSCWTLGAALLILFSRQVSGLTFGGTEHAAALSLLSIAVFLTLVSGAKGR